MNVNEEVWGVRSKGEGRHASYFLQWIQIFNYVFDVHLLKLVSMPTRTYSHLPSLLAVIFHPPPCGQPLLFPLNTISPILAVNFYPSCRSNSWSTPLPTTRSWCFKGREVRGELEKGDGRQGDRKTGTQGDKKTGRQGHRKTGTQRDRET